MLDAPNQTCSIKFYHIHQQENVSAALIQIAFTLTFRNHGHLSS